MSVNDNDFQMNKVSNGEYNIKFCLENKNIQLDKLVDFNLLKLLYDLNPDIYEKIDLQIFDDVRATILAINKHLFQDLGISQKYTHLEIQKSLVGTTKIVFDLRTVKDNSTENSLSHVIPENAEQLPIEKFIIVCDIWNQHKIETTIHFKIDTDLIEYPDFIENLVCKIFIKMFKRVKQFIDNTL
jgi:hypothetical protein